MNGQDRISITGPHADGTYVVEALPPGDKTPAAGQVDMTPEH
jgi:hypothetical protein